MKKVTETIQAYINNNVPFKVIDLPDYTIKLWWSNKSVNGYQCIAVLYFNKGGQHLFYKTSGHGYDKELVALYKALYYTNTAPVDIVNSIHTHCQLDLSLKYHVGGNYYKVPARDMRVIKRGLRK